MASSTSLVSSTQTYMHAEDETAASCAYHVECAYHIAPRPELCQLCACDSYTHLEQLMVALLLLHGACAAGIGIVVTHA